MKASMIRIGAVAVCAAVLVGASIYAPAGLRAIDAFNVQRVEVVGARYLTPQAAVAVSGITAASNLFDDPAPWRDALLAHPLVIDARITHRVPATLVLHITETMPVAFARTPEVRAIDERGRVLPVDPALDELDLPVLALDSRVDADGQAADEATLVAARFLGTVRRLEPGLLGWISEVNVRGDAVRMQLRNASDAEALMPAEPSADRLRELHLTLAELATPRYAVRAAGGDSTTTTAEPELARVRRIDGRFLDQIVVALHRGKN